MALIADYLFDAALAKLDIEANRLDICSAEPTTYTQATSTVTLGHKTGISIGSAGDRSPSGRKVTVAAISDGTVTATGTATHWAITDTGNVRLLATGPLAASRSVSAGRSFTLAAFDIGIPDAA